MVYTNRSPETCSLDGYPKVVVLDAADRQIRVARNVPQGYLRGCDCAPQQIRVKARAAASTLVEGDVFGGRECLLGEALLFMAPETTRSTRVAFAAYSCHVKAHPIVAGTGGGAQS